jgi:hypothetical protein
VWLDVTFTVVTRMVNRTERYKRDSRARVRGDAWAFYYVYGSAAVFAVPGVFVFGYMAGGVIWGAYAAAVTACFLAVSAGFHARR